MWLFFYFQNLFRWMMESPITSKEPSEFLSFLIVQKIWREVQLQFRITAKAFYLYNPGGTFDNFAPMSHPALWPPIDRLIISNCFRTRWRTTRDSTNSSSRTARPRRPRWSQPRPPPAPRQRPATRRRQTRRQWTPFTEVNLSILK